MKELLKLVSDDILGVLESKKDLVKHLTKDQLIEYLFLELELTKSKVDRIKNLDLK